MRPSSWRLLALISTVLAAGAASAQNRIWIVDAASAPGTDFVSLVTALPAVRDGDTVLVRAGTYSDAGTFFVLPGSLSIIGIGSPLVTTSGGHRYEFRTPRHHRLAISGMRFRSSTERIALQIDNVSSQTVAVHLRDCTFDCTGVVSAPIPVAYSPLFVNGRFSGGGLITLTAEGCAFRDFIGFFDCSGYLSQCSFRNRDEQALPPSFYSGTREVVYLARSHLRFSRCQVAQGAHQAQATVRYPVVVATGSSAVAEFTHGSTVTADMTLPGPSGPPLFHSDCPGSLVVGDDGSSVFTTGSAVYGPCVSGTTARHPALFVGIAVRGQTHSSSIVGGSGDASALFLSLASVPGTLFGSAVLLDFAAAILVGTATLDLQGKASFNLPVPVSYELSGVTLELQGLTLDLGNSRLALTNAGAIVVH